MIVLAFHMLPTTVLAFDGAIMKVPNPLTKARLPGQGHPLHEDCVDLFFMISGQDGILSLTEMSKTDQLCVMNALPVELS